MDIFTEFNNENAKKRRGGFVRVLRSTDKGSTWSGPFDVGRLGTIGNFDPETGDPVRTGDIIPDIAVDSTTATPTTGRLYAVWQDASFNGGREDAIALSQSLDGGLHWSTPIKINMTPPGLLGNQQAFTASVDVSADGTIAVTYYDFRSNTSAASLLTDYFVVHCHPTPTTSCLNPANWMEQQLTTESFDMRQAPFAGGFFTGDYEGLASAGNAFATFFSQPHGSDSASVFFRRAG
ncbi:MAG: sialidase family protein [Gaiellaceae bacterium]